VNIKEQVKAIMSKEKLRMWEVVFNDDSSDGLCLHDNKKIFVGLKYKPPLMLALHEIAHAQCSKEEDGHNNI
jgi:hypothetical protein